MPKTSLTRLAQYPVTDTPPWALIATNYNGPGTWTAACPECGADAQWTQRGELDAPQIHCDGNHP